MYLRTPKRYRPGRHRHLRLISRRVVLALILIPLLVVAGRFVWVNHEGIMAWFEPRLEQAAENIQTQVAPKPTVTPTPDLVVAQAGCVNNYRNGSLVDAVDDCQVLAESHPNDVELYYRVAHMLIVTSNFGQDVERINQALIWADKTINANPEAPYGWAIRAMALDWKGDVEGALASALHAKSLDPSFGPSYAFLGEIYHDLGQNELALEYLGQAITLDTSGLAIADAFRNTGLVYSNQGLYEDALVPYQTALEQAPNHTYIAVELANNYIALGDIDDAIVMLSDVQQRNPSDPTVLFALGRAYVRNSENDRAHEFFLRCLEAAPKNVPCLSWLGGLQWADQDYVQAISNLEQAVEYGSIDPVDFWQLGLSHIAMGRCDLALPYLRQGYQIAVEKEDSDTQTRIGLAMQECGASADTQAPVIPTPTLQATPIPQ